LFHPHPISKGTFLKRFIVGGLSAFSNKKDYIGYVTVLRFLSVQKVLSKPSYSKGYD
jgi:hypothetical protein